LKSPVMSRAANSDMLLDLTLPCLCKSRKSKSLYAFLHSVAMSILPLKPP